MWKTKRKVQDLDTNFMKPLELTISFLVDLIFFPLRVRNWTLSNFVSKRAHHWTWLKILQLIDCLLHWSKKMHQFHRTWLIAWLIKTWIDWTCQTVVWFWTLANHDSHTGVEGVQIPQAQSSSKLRGRGRKKKKKKTQKKNTALGGPENFSVNFFWSRIETTHQTQIQLQSGIVWHSLELLGLNSTRLQRLLTP